VPVVRASRDVYPARNCADGEDGGWADGEDRGRISGIPLTKRAAEAVAPVRLAKPKMTSATIRLHVGDTVYRRRNAKASPRGSAGERELHQRVTALQAQLLRDDRALVLDGAVVDTQRLGNLLAGLRFGNQPEDLALTFGQGR